ncbi:jg10273, partial [Pararge aegeria aegeria]
GYLPMKHYNEVISCVVNHITPQLNPSVQEGRVTTDMGRRVLSHPPPLGRYISLTVSLLDLTE